MLDGKEMAKRLQVAMDLHMPPISQVELAERCGVTKQAVHGWRTHGCVRKQHLVAIAEETGVPVMFFLEDRRSSSPDTAAVWQRFDSIIAMGKRLRRVAALAALLLLPQLLPDHAEAAHQNRAQSAVAIGIMLNRLCAFLHDSTLIMRNVDSLIREFVVWIVTIPRLWGQTATRSA